MDRREWYVVSDLHLNGDPGSRGIDAALPGFLESVVDPGRGGVLLLVAGVPRAGFDPSPPA